MLKSLGIFGISATIVLMVVGISDSYSQSYKYDSTNPLHEQKIMEGVNDAQNVVENIQRANEITDICTLKAQFGKMDDNCFAYMKEYNTAIKIVVDKYENLINLSK